MARRILAIVLVGICLLWANVGFALDKKEEWVEKTYEFKQVKTVLVQYSIPADINLSETERLKFEDMLKATFFKEDKKATVKYLTSEQSEEMIEKNIGVNLKELRATDNARYLDIMQKQLPTVADAILNINMTSLEYSTRHVPSYTEAYTDYEYQTVYEPYINSYGQHAGNVAKTIKVPVQRYRVVPAHDVQVGNAGAELKLMTTKDQQRVWLLLDVREEEDRTPINVTQRIFKRAKDRLKKMTKSSS